MNKRLSALQENDFCIQELTLYMDTHPKDTEALNVLNQHIKRRDALKKAAQREVGPLTNYDHDGCTWDWVNDPWPWDKED